MNWWDLLNFVWFCFIWIVNGVYISILLYEYYKNV